MAAAFTDVLLPEQALGAISPWGTVLLAASLLMPSRAVSCCPGMAAAFTGAEQLLPEQALTAATACVGALCGGHHRGPSKEQESQVHPVPAGLAGADRLDR